MTHLTVYQDQRADFTILSDRFIDEYMISANDAQIKIYLYLLRMTKANLPFSISDIADRFNYMEQDVLRALSYWEKQNLLSLDFDSSHTLKAIHILPFEQTNVSMTETTNVRQAEIVTFTPKLAVNNTTTAASLQNSSNVTKPNYTSDDLVAFQNNNDTAEIIFVAEQYTGKPLSPSDLQSLLFIYDKLGFSTDLIDYLIQYCVERGKKSFSYIQKVAINWADLHISTIEEAKSQSGKYDKSVYTIMKALGKNSDPVDTEVKFIQKWTKEMGFSLDIILNACERTVLATDKHRFEYANGILTKWYQAHVKNLNDVMALEEKHSAKVSSSGQSAKTGTGFSNFSQRDYDYNALEQALLKNN